MKLTWLGHACFKIEAAGYVLLIDPYSAGSVPGYRPLDEAAHEVLCTHGHRDHNAAGEVRLLPARESPFNVKRLSAWHDGERGALRGPNDIIILEAEKLRLAHMGDTGCELTGEQYEALAGMDTLLIPTGGIFTIDAAQARAIADKIAARVTIPMHYRSGGCGYAELATVDEFVRLSANVRYGESAVEIVPAMTRQTLILSPQYGGRE